MYRSRQLEVLAEWTSPARRPGARKNTSTFSPTAQHGARADGIERRTEEIRTWLTDWLVDRENVPAESIDLNRPFAEYGLSSLTALELTRELEEWLNVRLTPVVAWRHPTPAMLARYLARGASDGADTESPPVEIRERRRTVREFTRLLAHIEALDEDLEPAAPRSREGSGSAEGGP
jgi:acyl carrier protein